MLLRMQLPVEGLVSLETWEEILHATFSNLVLEYDAEKQEKLRESFAIAGGFRMKPGDKIEDIAARFRKRKVREFYLYLIFCLFFTASTLQQAENLLSDANVNFLLVHETAASRTDVRSLQTIVRWDRVWVVVPNVNVVALAANVRPDRLLDSAALLTSKDSTILGAMRISGYGLETFQKPRLRQIRVKPQACSVIKRFNPDPESSETCYPAYSSGDVDTSPWFGVELDEQGDVRDTVVEYQTSKQLMTASYTPPKLKGKAIVYVLCVANGVDED
eukprot:768582-Hanusia_phi.AAC.8